MITTVKLLRNYRHQNHNQQQDLVLPHSSNPNIQLRTDPTICCLVYLFFSYLSVYNGKILQQICSLPFFPGDGTNSFDTQYSV
jgi:hypothetical protein